MVEVTIKDIYNKAIELGNADPDFNYKGQAERRNGERQCYYVGANSAGTGRGCLIGEAMQALGITKEHILKFRNDEARIFVPVVIGINRHPADKEDELLNAIQEMQDRQDCNDTWGQAVSGFKEEN